MWTFFHRKFFTHVMHQTVTVNVRFLWLTLSEASLLMRLFWIRAKFLHEYWRWEKILLGAQYTLLQGFKTQISSSNSLISFQILNLICAHGFGKFLVHIKNFELLILLCFQKLSIYPNNILEIYTCNHQRDSSKTLFCFATFVNITSARSVFYISFNLDC